MAISARGPFRGRYNNMRLHHLLTLALLLWPGLATAQIGGGGGAAGGVRSGGTLPATCGVGGLFQKTGSSAGLYYCSATNTWTSTGSGGGGGGISFADLATPPAATALGTFDTSPFATGAFGVAQTDLDPYIQNWFGGSPFLSVASNNTTTTGAVTIQGEGMQGLGVVNFSLQSAQPSSGMEVDSYQGVSTTRRIIGLGVGFGLGPGVVHTVQSMQGITINTPSFEAGSSSPKAVGLRIEDISGAVTNFAIETAGSAPSVFGGTVTATDFIPTDTYKSVDGSSGVTVTTCTSFKNSICVAGS